MKIKAPAKLNLILNILGKRDDGYHEIETVFYALDLFDIVEINEGTKDSVVMKYMNSKKLCKDEINIKDNLAYKALKLMKDSFKKESCYEIIIEKNIPIAGGLGGGSCDAAAVVYLLEKMWNILYEAENKEKIDAICKALGSDVPFCYLACKGIKACIGKGRGEILEVIDLPEMKFDFLIEESNIKNKTASVYKELKKEDYEIRYDIEAMLKEKNITNISKYFGNHLQKPLERLTKKEIKTYILCGAGPCYFKLKE